MFDRLLFDRLHTCCPFRQESWLGLEDFRWRGSFLAVVGVVGRRQGSTWAGTWLRTIAIKGVASGPVQDITNLNGLEAPEVNRRSVVVIFE